MRAFDPALSPRIRTAVGLLVMAIPVTACFIVLLVRGTVFIPLGEVIDVLAGGEGTRSIHRIIVMDARLSKAITAVLAGAALGVGGAMMQTLFCNPLADPYVLGGTDIGWEPPYDYEAIDSAEVADQIRGNAGAGKL